MRAVPRIQRGDEVEGHELQLVGLSPSHALASYRLLPKRTSHCRCCSGDVMKWRAQRRSPSPKGSARVGMEGLGGRSAGKRAPSEGAPVTGFQPALWSSKFHSAVLSGCLERSTVIG